MPLGVSCRPHRLLPPPLRSEWLLASDVRCGGPQQTPSSAGTCGWPLTLAQLSLPPRPVFSGRRCGVNRVGLPHCDAGSEQGGNKAVAASSKASSVSTIEQLKTSTGDPLGYVGVDIRGGHRSSSRDYWGSKRRPQTFALSFPSNTRNHWQLVVICNKGLDDMPFLMLLDSLHMGEQTRIENELKNFLKIAYEGKEIRTVADELKVIDLHVPKLTADWFSREEYEKFREDLQGKRIHIDARSTSTSKRKFDVPISLHDFVMKDLDQKWRSWKYDLRTKFFTPYQKAQQHFACSDTRVEDQWKNLVQIWSSEEFKQSSTSSSIASVGDAYEQVMGRDKTGRVRGIGTGPTPKSLWGSRSEQKLHQDNESLKEKIDDLEERMKKIESRGNNEDSLAGRRVRILNFSGEVVASGILMSDDNDNVVMGKKLGGEYYELDSMKDSSSTSSFPAVEVDQKTEGIEDLGADEIAKEIKNVKRQNNITH
ncbi:hypothetical protein Taro_020087, partial [Colocasia esculenta]|nr:hypothetical protein [Colocasia esculenta]